MGIPKSIAIFSCESCGSHREQDAEREGLPVCGVLHTDTDVSPFPNGNWVRVTVETYESHGEMRLCETVAGNPLADVVAAGERSRERQRREQLENGVEVPVGGEGYALLVDEVQVRTQFVGPDGEGPLGPVKEGL